MAKMPDQASLSKLTILLLGIIISTFLGGGKWILTHTKEVGAIAVENAKVQSVQDSRITKIETSFDYIAAQSRRIEIQMREILVEVKK